ncbi:MAG: hypothetical protein WA130_05275 [Candidatus Methanoperedens sp.]
MGIQDITLSSTMIHSPIICTLAGISYAHMPGLGGLRHARKDSPNTGGIIHLSGVLLTICLLLIPRVDVL